MVKNCDLRRENAAQGLRPRAAFSSPRSHIFTLRTSQPANNIYIQLNVCVARALRQMPFQVFCGKRLGKMLKFSCHYLHASAELYIYGGFRSTSPPDNDLRSALESKNK